MDLTNLTYIFSLIVYLWFFQSLSQVFCIYLRCLTCYGICFCQFSTIYCNFGRETYSKLIFFPKNLPMSKKSSNFARKGKIVFVIDIMYN